MSCDDNNILVFECQIMSFCTILVIFIIYLYLIITKCPNEILIYYIAMSHFYIL